ncbi:hypothetical protein WK53_17055 [Burkholderia ubonensis]|uniref:Uncharacterized protein n=1 Tax=Burkholderia ubonensis TaxID=101571 RepID=A0AAW3N635_9BURK|nr:hypothetical protein WK53_17055 [Burkholderia ubonensis]
MAIVIWLIMAVYARCDFPRSVGAFRTTDFLRVDGSLSSCLNERYGNLFVGIIPCRQQPGAEITSGRRELSSFQEIVIPLSFATRFDDIQSELHAIGIGLYSLFLLRLGKARIERLYGAGP